MDNITGTSGNDTIRSIVDADANNTNNTLAATDAINGGAGTDTLEIVAVGTAAVTSAPLFLNAVEKVSVKDTTAANGTTLDLNNATGVAEVINNGSSAAIAFQNIGSAAVTVQNMTGTTATTFTRSATASVTSDVTLNLSSIGSAAIPGTAAVQGGAISSLDNNNDATKATINANGYVSVASVELTGTGGAGHTATSLTVNAAGTTIFGTIAAGGADVIGFDTTKSAIITVTGAGAVSLNDLAAVVQTVDASANTGGVTLAGTQYNTGTNAAALAAPGLKLTGGSGNDAFTLDGVASAVVAAGAGNDTVTINNGTLASGASISGGDGTDTINFTNADITALSAQTAAGAALRAAVTGFEKLGVSNAVSAAINAAQAGSYNSIVLAGSVDDADANQVEGAINLSGVTSGATIELRAIAAAQADTDAAGPMVAVAAGVQEDVLNVVMTDAASSSSDVLNLRLAANLTNANSDAQATYKVAIQGINNVAVTAVDRVNDVTDDNAAANAQDGGADEGYTLQLTNAANLNTLTVSGTSALNHTLDASATAIRTIDASASTGNLTLSVAAFAGTERLEIIGSQGVNNITGDNAAFGEKITGGARNDVINGGAGADDLYGNGGRDSFTIANGDGGLTASTLDQIFDFGLTTAAILAADNAAGNNGTVALLQAATNQKGGANADVIDFGTAPTLAAAAGAASVVVTLEALDGTQNEFAGKTINAALSAKGIITLSGADVAMVDTLAEWNAIANQLIGGTPGNVAAFEFNGSTYVYQDIAAGDNVIQLVGVTGATGINVAGGGVAVAAGELFVI